MSEVLALKYRPQSFEGMIGQSHTVDQLKAALINNTLGHALIFCGTRGSGKTTSARIIARELNRAVSEGDWKKVSPILVKEIDAASNNGVDDVRAIVEDVRYSRQGHSVVILDEAHMLTRNAFNALLKTLEEPPPAVTFILLTTEPHKLIPTVRSRCQVYEFHDLDVETLAEHYTRAARAEGLNISSDVIKNIALKAEGSVRDGLTILQKFLSGETDEDYDDKYYNLVQAIYLQDSTTALALADQLKKVEDSRVIIQTLEKWFYWCSLEALGQKTPIRDKLPGNPSFNLPYLQRLFNECLSIEQSFSATPNGKTVLDMGILGLTLT